MQVIPKINVANKGADSVNINDFVVDIADEQIKNIVNEYIFDKIKSSGKRVGKVVWRENKQMPHESYKLLVQQDNIRIEAADYVGALYAVQTLRQMADADMREIDNAVALGEYFDEPRYSWRGLMLDESRHFFGMDVVKKLLDSMVLYKLNVFHWHLTDDPGWRIEIKKYPRLTEIGSKRCKTNIHGWGSTDDDGTPHEGFYTQEQIKEIVKYASDRGIMIVPEIDMPAHFAAAFAAYPHLACREIETEVPWYFGGRYPLSQGIKDWNRSACIGKESTFQFIYDVIDEVCELFPSPYFHIGGDEAPKEEWESCPHCQKLMREQGLKTVEELQGYFICKVNDYVKSKGKSLVGWNEVLEGKNLDSSVIVQYWTPRKDKLVAEHMNKGGKIVLSKHNYFYFDMTYAQYPLSNTYNFNPYIDGITKANDGNILGVEGELWTEWIGTPDKLELHTYPRLQALAEAGWDKHKDSFGKFRSRLDEHKALMDKQGINYAVDKISICYNLIKRGRVWQLWGMNDQDWELRHNSEYKRNGKK